jgi:hypothetical protein
VVYDDMGAPQVAELLRLLLTIAACCWIAAAHFRAVLQRAGRGGGARQRGEAHELGAV